MGQKVIEPLREKTPKKSLRHFVEHLACEEEKHKTQTTSGQIGFQIPKEKYNRLHVKKNY
ncbi:hypothetical protein Hanom_Chr10g00915721 [Helianthus anomalus]